jgi:hypothetical protein
MFSRISLSNLAVVDTKATLVPRPDTRQLPFTASKCRLVKRYVFHLSFTVSPLDSTSCCGFPGLFGHHIYLAVFVGQQLVLVLSDIHRIVAGCFVRPDFGLPLETGRTGLVTSAYVSVLAMPRPSLRDEPNTTSRAHLFPCWQGLGRVFAMISCPYLFRAGKTLVEPLR